MRSFVVGPADCRNVVGRWRSRVSLHAQRGMSMGRSIHSRPKRPQQPNAPSRSCAAHPVTLAGSRHLESVGNTRAVWESTPAVAGALEGLRWRWPRPITPWHAAAPRPVGRPLAPVPAGAQTTATPRSLSPAAPRYYATSSAPPPWLPQPSSAPSTLRRSTWLFQYGGPRLWRTAGHLGRLARGGEVASDAGRLLDHRHQPHAPLAGTCRRSVWLTRAPEHRPGAGSLRAARVATEDHSF